MFKHKMVEDLQRFNKYPVGKLLSSQEYYVKDIIGISLFNKSDTIKVSDWFYPPHENMLLTFDVPEASGMATTNTGKLVKRAGLYLSTYLENDKKVFYIQEFVFVDNIWCPTPFRCEVVDGMDRYRWLVGYRPKNKTEVETLKKTCWIQAETLITLFRFLRCRGIITKKIEPNQKINKKRIKNRKIPADSYYVLTIPHTVVKTQYIPSKTDNKKQMRLHTVRGHFRTYTPERPLFGWYFGDLFIPDYMRGNKDLGTIDKDYII